jgi:hypothetical protein
LAYLAIQDVDSFKPVLLGHPMFDDLAVIPVQIGVEKVQVDTSVTEDEIIDDLGI